MKKSEKILIVEEYDSIDELSSEDSSLLLKARSATQFAHAPYSGFNVGAAAKLANNEIVIGTNQENASYPAGICAERVLLSSSSSQYPNIAINTIAISYNNLKGKSDTPVSPCGICRQSLSEYQHRFKMPIKLILSGMEGRVQIIKNAEQLLPLAFGSNDLE